MYRQLTQQRGTHVVSALERTYETILGEKKRLAEALYECEGVESHDLAYREWFVTKKTLDDLLQALETTILLFCPKWDRNKMRPKVRHLSPKLVSEPSGVVASMFRVLRHATYPLTVAELVVEVADDLKLKTSRCDQKQRLYGAIYNALKRYKVKEMVIATDETPAKWALAEQADDTAYATSEARLGAAPTC